MNGTERFTDMDAVHAEMQRLATVRNGHAQRLQREIQRLGQKETRRALMREAVGSAWGNLVPEGGLLGAVASRKGLARALELAVGTRGSWGRRIGVLALGLAAPSLLERLGKISFTDLGAELQVSLDRIKGYFRDRNGGPTQAPGK